MKKIISLITVLVVMMSCVVTSGLNVNAAGNSVIKFSSSNVDVGEEVTVTVSVNADENMLSLKFALQYDPQVLEFVSSSGVCSGGAGLLSVADSVGNTKSKSLTYTFKALKAGSCYIATNDLAYVNFDEDMISVADQGANITVKDVSLSDNANLKSLKVSNGSLSPSFSPSTTSYSLTVGKGVTDCKIYATADDSDAKVQVEGGSDLKVGKNNCTVIVTAANGSQKTYNIVITREDETSSEEESSSDESSSDESSSEEESSETEGTLDVTVEGSKYTVAQELKGVKIPLGFSAKKATYNDNEVTVITDETEERVIYYLSKEKSKELVPYTLNPDTNSFEKVKYLSQGGRYYIFEDFPEETNVANGFYGTSTYIADSNIPCYANNAPELSTFYYVYCFNGEESGYYRYDTVENVLQRYPEMSMDLTEETVSTEVEENFLVRFANLTRNAKIIVIGFLLVIIGFVILAILLVLRFIRYRNGAMYDPDMGFDDEFDDINFINKFSLENEEYMTDDDVTADLDFGDETDDQQDIPDYLISGDPEEGSVLPEEEIADYLTDDDEDDTEE